MEVTLNDFYKHSYAVISSFNVCDSQTQNHLHLVFCLSLYGIEYYNHKYMSDLYVAWRNVIKQH